MVRLYVGQFLVVVGVLGWVIVLLGLVEFRFSRLEERIRVLERAVQHRQGLPSIPHAGAGVGGPAGGGVGGNVVPVRPPAPSPAPPQEEAWEEMKDDAAEKPTIPPTVPPMRSVPKRPRPQHQRGCPVTWLRKPLDRGTLEDGGWEFRVNELHLQPSALTAWTTASEIGSLAISFTHAGNFTLEVHNAHLAQNVVDNFVTVHMNGMQLAELGPGQRQRFCVNFEEGDQFEILEAYAIIELDFIAFECRTSTSIAQGICLTGQRVRMGFEGCGGTSSSWLSGVVEKVIDAERAFVRFEPMGERRRVPPELLRRAEASTRCGGYPPVLHGKRIGILIFADKNFQRKYDWHIQSQRCYAERHGYSLTLLEGGEYEECNRAHGQRIFFRKHCAVATFLESQPDNFVVMVLDADVVAAVMARGLEEWAVHHEADLQFYQRVGIEEIAAGNYIARNTPFARKFLRDWASYSSRRIVGFNSEDNGAIHVLLLKVLRLEGAEQCEAMYNSLVSPLPGGPEYFAFVNCTLRLLGKPRSWQLKDGNITIWPRFHFVLLDAYQVLGQASPEFGPIMHHGMKEREKWKDHYFHDVQRCVANPAFTNMPEAHWRLRVLRYARVYPAFFPTHGDYPLFNEVCLRSLTCDPRNSDDPPLPKRLPPA